MPPADFRALVIGAKSGHAQNNGSWVVGRLLRDYEKQAKPHTMIKESMSWEALRISVFKIRVGSQPGRPRCDWVWYSGFVIAVIQIIIALIPLYLYSEWIALFVTITGTLLAFSHGALPQWKKEKWETAKSGGGTVTITQGNGSRHAMVILGSQDAMDLEILAYRDGNTMCTPSTRIWCAVHTVLWLVLVVTVAGLKRGTWCKYFRCISYRIHGC